jgi:hypothetical protein
MLKNDPNKRGVVININNDVNNKHVIGIRKGNKKYIHLTSKIKTQNYLKHLSTLLQLNKSLIKVSLGVTSFYVLTHLSQALRQRGWLNFASTRVQGYTEFPRHSLETLAEPFLDKAVEKVQSCEYEPPKICEDTISCQKTCGPRFSCQTIDVETLYNGSLLYPGQSYCLPDGHSSFGCKNGVSYMNSTFNPISLAPEYTCTCKFPDIFGGSACDQIIACRDPENVSRICPVQDYLTNTLIDLETYTGRENINFYETLDTGEPRYRCACKKTNPLMTSAFSQWRCVRDPCFAHLDFPPHSSALGLIDNINMASDSVDCECGDPSTTRLYSNGKLRCLGLQDRNCVQMKKVGDQVVCDCTQGYTFIPCRSDKRPHEYNPWCGQNGAYRSLLPLLAPESGSCEPICETCSHIAFPFAEVRDGDKHSICNDNMRTRGVCSSTNLPSPDYTTDLRQQDLFQCHCSSDISKYHWGFSNIIVKGQQCHGGFLPCSKFQESCSTSVLNYGVDQGLLCCGDGYMGVCSAEGKCTSAPYTTTDG